jgi:hypothetical protein
MVPPFAKQTHYAVAGDNVYVGTQDAPEIRVHGFDGALRRIIRTGRAMEAVTEQHLQAMFERRLEGMPEERRAEAIAAGRGNLPHGTHVPPHDRLVTDRDGNLWVADYNNAIDPAGHWTVYGSDGGVIARIALPERFIPYDIGSDWIMGRELDELDVEHVRSYRIVRE